MIIRSRYIQVLTNYWWSSIGCKTKGNEAPFHILNPDQPQIDQIRDWWLIMKKLWESDKSHWPSMVSGLHYLFNGTQAIVEFIIYHIFYIFSFIQWLIVLFSNCIFNQTWWVGDFPEPKYFGREGKGFKGHLT